MNGNGLSTLEYSDDRGDLWLEIRPPPATSFRVPFYGYRTHLMRLIVDRHLSYWLEVLGHCVRSGTFRSLTSGGIDPSLVKPLVDLLSGGALVCQGRGSVLKRVQQFHPKTALEQGLANQDYFTLPDYRYRSYDCLRLIDARSGATQCSSCMKNTELPRQPQLELIHSSSAASRSSRQQQNYDPQFRNLQQQSSTQQQQRPPQTNQHNVMHSNFSVNEPLNLSVHHATTGLSRSTRELKTPLASTGFLPLSPNFNSTKTVYSTGQQVVNVPNVSSQTQLSNQQQHHHRHHHHYACTGSPVASLLDQNQDDYRLAKETAFLSLSSERDHSGFTDCFDSPLSSNRSQTRKKTMADPLLLNHSPDDQLGACYDPDFRSTWIKQEMFDASNGDPS